MYVKSYVNGELNPLSRTRNAKNKNETEGILKTWKLTEIKRN